MTELLTAAQMRAIEQAAIDSGEVTGLELMERAGRGVVEAVFEEWPELAKTSHRAVVLCGPGNNGGDGFVVARLLKEWGWQVEVFFYGDVTKLPSDARVNYERWSEMGEVMPLVSKALSGAVDRADGFFDESLTGDGSVAVGISQRTVFVDALFGTGLSKPFDQGLLDISGEWTDTCYEYSVAVDMPSGLSSDSGNVVGENWFFSKLIVTFETPKVGHYLGLYNYDVQSLKVVDLDISWVGLSESEVVSKLDCDDIELDQKGWFKNGLQKPSRFHKFSHGHALIVTGGPGKTGAARLSARGALRIGAGVVTLGVPPSAQMEVAGHITALMLTRVADAEALAEVLQDTRINALCLGPGLGYKRARALVPVACGGVEPRPTVLDADALSAYADDPEELFAMLHDACVLTPHGGEFAHLFPDIARRLQKEPKSGPAYSKVDATREAARRAGCVVLFKGADTVIAAPDGRASINAAHYERAAPWLATAGSGDVLAGFIAGLLARGFQPMQAAESAAWLHVECALEFGPGLIAEDIPETLPMVFRKLGL